MSSEQFVPQGQVGQDRIDTAFGKPPTNLPEPELSSEQIAAIRVADKMFDELCQQRHDTGKLKYGNFTFLDMPTIKMAMEELIDVANYARYTFIKLQLLKLQIEAIQEAALQDGFYDTRTITDFRKPV